MRWLVEVSLTAAKTDLHKFCVEAESWQRALQAARAQRGEEGPMSGFSIELLEEGYRAVDPLTRIRFVVKRAPDDMPITAPLAKDGKTGVAPSPPSMPPSPLPPQVGRPSAGPPAAAAATAPAQTDTKVATTGKKSVPPRPNSDKSNGPASTMKKGLFLDAHAPAPKAEEKKSIAPAVSASVAPPAPVIPAAPLLPVGAFIPGLPSVKVLSQREQNPTDASPLTYREYSFAVPAGTSEDVAVNVLKGQLRLVDAHLENAKMGKLVNLAVFDVEFTGKPPGPPLATLTWKDWKGDPVIGYPRRGAGPKQVKPPTAGAGNPPPPSAPVPPSAIFPPPSLPGPSLQNPAVAPTTITDIPVAAPISTAAVAEAARVAVPEPGRVAFPPPAAVPAPVAAVAQPVPVPVPPSFVAVTGEPANPFTSTAPLIPQALLPQQPVASSSPASVPAAPAPPAHPGSVPPPATHASQPPLGHIPVVAPVTMFKPATIPPPGTSVPPPAIMHAPTTSEPPRRPSSPDGMVRTPSGRFVRGRTTGDELITALFESMHDLHFLRDALDGGQFCLALATEVLPARAALIHFFDIEKREWVIACTRGKDTNRMLTIRTPETDEILRDAARKRRAVVLSNAGAATAQRYQTIGGSRSVIIAPIMQAGRALGAMELINPLDGMPFNEDEGNAMTYIAEQYAEYLGSRGIVLDRERIQSAASAPR
jgi:hypothetical protein